MANQRPFCPSFDLGVGWVAVGSVPPRPKRRAPPDKPPLHVTLMNERDHRTHASLSSYSLPLESRLTVDGRQAITQLNAGFELATFEANSCRGVRDLLNATCETTVRLLWLLNQSIDVTVIGGDLAKMVNLL